VLICANLAIGQARLLVDRDEPWREVEVDRWGPPRVSWA
jgi:hypothetical protein